MRNIFLIGLVGLLIFAWDTPCIAQVVEYPSDTVKVKKRKKERNHETLQSDSLAEIVKVWKQEKEAQIDSIRKANRKPKPKRIDTVNVYSNSTYSIVTQVDDSTAEEQNDKKRNRKSKRSEKDSTIVTSDENQNEYDNSNSDAVDTSNISIFDKPKKERKREKQVEENYINWDSVAIANTPLTEDQIASMLLDSGSYYLNKNENERAIFYFDSLVMHYPNTFQHRFGFYFRGRAKMAMNKDVPAMVDFNYFNQLDKCQSNFCTDSHYNLAVLKFRNDRMAECLNELNWVFKDSTYKNYRYAFFYRAFCHAKEEKYIPAIQDLTQFILLDENKTYSSAEALYYRGFYKARMEDNRGAIRDYDEAIKMYEAGMNAKGGNNYLQKLIETYIVRAVAKSEIKKYDEAIADYDMVIKLNPKYPTAYRLKGLAEINKGLKDDGCLNLSRAGELGSNEAYEDIKQHCK